MRFRPEMALLGKDSFEAKVSYSLVRNFATVIILRNGRMRMHITPRFVGRGGWRAIRLVAEILAATALIRDLLHPFDHRDLPVDPS